MSTTTLPEIDDDRTRRRLAALARGIARLREHRPGLSTTAAVGALATAGTAAADPSTTDDDPDHGLPGDRTDFWADGVDAVDAWIGRYAHAPRVETVSGSVTLDPNAATAAELTIGGDTTLSLASLPAGAPDGATYAAVVQQDGSTPYAITWPSATLDSSDAYPSLSAGESVLVRWTTYDGGSSYYARVSPTF
jgi:hypothetical protein